MTIKNLGMLYLGLDRREEGMAEVQKAVSLAPNRGITHYYLSKAYRYLEKPAAAYAESRRAADLDPRNVEYQYQSALDSQHRNDYEAVLTYLARIKAVLPEYRFMGFMEGLALQKSGRWEEAESSYRKFVEHRPNYARAWFNLGYVLLELEHYQKAIEAFAKFLSLSPDNGKAHHWIAVAYRKLGDTDTAELHEAIYADHEQTTAHHGSVQDPRVKTPSREENDRK